MSTTALINPPPANPGRPAERPALSSIDDDGAGAAKQRGVLVARKRRRRWSGLRRDTHGEGPPRGASMAESRRIIYTAEAHVTGGRAEGHGRASDGALEVDLRTPVEMGGSGGGTNPEQLFAIGYAACFESAIGVVARRRRHDVADVAIDSKVMLLPTADRGFKLAVALAVTLPSVHGPHEAVELVRGAHLVCPYSNATRGNVDVSLTANGLRVDDVSEPLAVDPRCPNPQERYP
jgi:lipoyl-dependent peroxiredoxin